MSDADKHSKPELSALRIDRGDELAGESRAKIWRAVRWALALAAVAFLGAKAHSRWVKPMRRKNTFASSRSRSRE